MSRTKSARKISLQDFSLAPMTEHDLLEVVEIEEASGLSRWGWEAYHAELMGGQNALMLVIRRRVAQPAINAERIAGFIAARLTGEEIHINNLAVRPAYRRQGMGGQLLDAVLKEGARLGARAALLEVRAANAGAQALYLGRGFQMAGRRRHYYSAPTEDALVMKRTIRS